MARATPARAAVAVAAAACLLLAAPLAHAHSVLTPNGAHRCGGNGKAVSFALEIALTPQSPDAHLLVPTVNGTSPGPVLAVNEGDWVVVNVTNALGVRASVSWPGMHLPDTGAAVRAAQHLIPPTESAVYGFCAKRAGTFVYQAYAPTLDISTAAGAIIVRSAMTGDYSSSDEEGGAPALEATVSPAALDEWVLYAHESLEMSADIRVPSFFTEHISSSSAPAAILVNGASFLDEADYAGVEGSSTALRILGGRLSTPVNVTVDGEQLIIVELDGATVAPKAVPWFLLYPSQRVTAIVTWRTTTGADQQQDDDLRARIGSHSARQGDDNTARSTHLRVTPVSWHHATSKDAAAISDDALATDAFTTRVRVLPASVVESSGGQRVLHGDAPAVVSEPLPQHDHNHVALMPARDAPVPPTTISLRSHVHITAGTDSVPAVCKVTSQQVLSALAEPLFPEAVTRKLEQSTKMSFHAGAKAPCMHAKHAALLGMKAPHGPDGPSTGNGALNAEANAIPPRAAAQPTKRSGPAAHEHTLPAGSAVELTITNHDDAPRVVSLYGASFWLVATSQQLESAGTSAATTRDVAIVPASGGWIRVLVPIHRDGLYDTSCEVGTGAPFSALQLHVLEPLVFKRPATAPMVDQPAPAGGSEGVVGGGPRKLQVVPSAWPYAAYDGFNRNPAPAPANRNGAGTWFQPLARPNYGDGRGSIGIGPNARNISNVVANMPPFRYNNFGISAIAAAWGQFIAHDMILTAGMDNSPTPAADYLTIPVPTGDPDMDPHGTGRHYLDFTRTWWDIGTGNTTASPRRQINAQTGWMDASTVYGFSSGRADMLRAFFSGLMLADPVNGLPVNRHCIGMAAPGAWNSACYQRLAGDVRANVAPGITSLHGLFVLEHNYWARTIGAAHPTWDDETVFQEARKRVMAEIQAISVNQYLTSVLGESLPPYRGYNASVDPRITPVFAVAAYRYGHSGIDTTYWCIKADGKQCPSGNLLLREQFFNPKYMEWGITIADLLRGMTVQLESNIDTAMVPDVRNHLVGLRDDLAAQDIMRGRDFGVPTFATARRQLGMQVPTKFTDITSNLKIAKALEEAYEGNVSAVDLWVGGLAESATSGKFMGPTFKAIIIDQMARLRDGDWFWYENTANNQTLADGTSVRYLTDEDIARVRSTTLGHIIARNTDWPDAVLNPFRTTGVVALGSNSMALASASNTASSSSSTASTSSSSGSSTSTTTSGTGTSTTTGGGASIAASATPSPAAAAVSPSPTASTSAAAAATTTTVARVSINNFIGLEWAPPAQGETSITITVYFTGDGWLGLGLGSSGMIGADVWLMRRSSAASGGEVVDTKATGYMLPSSDGRQDVTLISATRANGKTAFKLRRALNTGDGNDFAIVSGSIPMVFAWDTASTTYGYHGGNRITTSVNFLSPPANQLVVVTVSASGVTSTGNGTSDGFADMGTDDPDAIARAALVQSYGWHGLSMFFVWAILVPAGVMTVRFMKHRPSHQAFHKWTMLTATTITLPAAGGALIQSTQHEVNIAHAKVGMALAALLLMEVVWGAMVRSWLSGDKVPPFYWSYLKKCHGFVGWGMLLAGLSNCVLGVDMLIKDGRWIMLVYASILVSIFSIMLVIARCKRARAKASTSVVAIDGEQGRRIAMSQSKFSLTVAELRANVRAGSQWVIVQGYIYDVAHFTKHHPGGAYLLHKVIGNDITQLFFGRESFDRNVPAYLHSEQAHKLLKSMCIAALKSTIDLKSWADVPTLDDRECTAQWIVVKKTVVGADARRPIIKLELAHASANACAALDWLPQAFGRHMIARASPAQIKAILEREGIQTRRLSLSRRSRGVDDFGESMLRSPKSRGGGGAASPVPASPAGFRTGRYEKDKDPAAVGGPTGGHSGSAAADAALAAAAASGADVPEPLSAGAVERPYTIVRADNKPGLILYVRRYPKGALSPYMSCLREGDAVTLAGPKGLGLHLDNNHSGVIVGIFQGTCVCAAFDLLQYIVAAAAERKEGGKSTRRSSYGGVDGRSIEDVPSHTTVAYKAPASRGAGVGSGGGAGRPSNASRASSPAMGGGGGGRSSVSSATSGAIQRATSPTRGRPPVVLYGSGSDDDHGIGIGRASADTDGDSTARSQAGAASAPARSRSLYRAASYRDAVAAGGRGGSTALPRVASMAHSITGEVSLERPHLKLVLMVVAEHEDAIVERDWLRHLDQTCEDFELHVNLKTIRNPIALAGMQRVYTGRLTQERLDNVLPPTDLLTVSVCGTPQFQLDVSAEYSAMGLPRSLLTIVS